MKKWRELNSQETISSTSLMSVRQPWEGLEIESVNSMMNLHQPRWVQCQSFVTFSSSNHCFYPPLFYQLCIMACISFIPSTSTILCQEKPTVLYDLPHHIPLISTSKLYQSFSCFFLTTAYIGWSCESTRWVESEWASGAGANAYRAHSAHTRRSLARGGHCAP